MQLLDGKALAARLEEKVALRVKQCALKPSLAVILVGEDAASRTYVNMKRKACERVGIISRLYSLSKEITEHELFKVIDSLNDDENVHGILVQLPLPNQINSNLVLEKIAPLKDVDGFHPYNIGKISANLPAFAPATPLGIMQLLKEYNIQLKGANVVIVGASNIVGKPLATLMTNAQATVTLCHIHTQNLPSFTRQADILCIGIGKPKFITFDMVKQGAIVVDVGINRLQTGALIGDVDFNEVSCKCSYITPVPGGVGPMTIVSLLSNTIEAFKLQYKE